MTIRLMPPTKHRLRKEFPGLGHVVYYTPRGRWFSFTVLRILGYCEASGDPLFDLAETPETWDEDSTPPPTTDPDLGVWEVQGARLPQGWSLTTAPNDCGMTCYPELLGGPESLQGALEAVRLVAESLVPGGETHPLLPFGAPS